MSGIPWLAVARDDVANLARRVDSAELDEDGELHAVADVTQASTTLAVAEEMRTANLIAFLAVCQAPAAMGQPGPVLNHHGASVILAEVNRRLDLDDIEGQDIP